MKKLVLIIVVISSLLSSFQVAKSNPPIRMESQVRYVDNSEVERGDVADDMLDNVDVDKVQEYFDKLTDEQKAVFGDSLMEFLQNTVNGNSQGFDSFFDYALSVLGKELVEVIPLLLSVVAVVILISVIGGLKGSFASKSVDDIVNFAGIAIVSTMILLQVFSAITQTSKLVSSLNSQMEAFFPLLFTLMSTLGATGSVAVYQPAVALLSFGVTKIITSIVLPMVIITVVFSIVGNLSTSIKMGGMAKFSSSATKWILGSTCFLFFGFLSVKGITAAIYDNMSVRTAKFALSKYVPIIGGYLSEGFNVVLANTVLIKNAIGSVAIIMMFVSVLPALIHVIILTLTLKLTSALVEPFSNERVSGVINGVSSAISTLTAVIIAVTFSYFVFLLLLILSGNLVL